ncbi:vegetative incompatibility protein HET-E-1 isoform X2 [Exaiptasia diaphana]|nr:vegetative incompatibility protein HET-E-1 isoform X2 [Exaiptasia diaphana]
MGQAGSVSFQEKELDVFRGSDQSILNCEVSPNGKHLATCSKDSNIYVWRLPTDTEPGELLQTLEGHKEEVTSCSFSGSILASASQSGGVILWHYQTGKRASRIDLHRGPVYDCLFAHDGQSFATSSNDTTVRRFKIKTGAGEFVPGLDTKTLNGHRSAVCALAFTPDDTCIISGSEDGKIKKWSRKEGQCLETQDSQYGPVRAIKFPTRCSHPDDIFATLAGSSIVIWNLRETMEIRLVLSNGDSSSRQGRNMQAICFVPDSSYLVGVSSDNYLTVWDPLGHNPSKPISVKQLNHQGYVQCCCFDPNGRYFITADSAGYTKIWY